MRISDWSSDVCSSDLTKSSCTPPPSGADLTLTSSIGVGEGYGETGLFGGAAGLRRAGAGGVQRIEERHDRKSVVYGKSVSVRVALGGRRIIKKKTSVDSM